MASERRPRSKSARARLTTTKMDLEESLLEQNADYVRSKRAKSAMSNRTRAEVSRYVMPRHAETEEFEQTQYTAQFEAKAGETPEMRPSSPTRRNNPHPADVSCICAGTLRRSRVALRRREALPPVRLRPLEGIVLWRFDLLCNI